MEQVSGLNEVSLCIECDILECDIADFYEIVCNGEQKGGEQNG